MSGFNNFSSDGSFLEQFKKMQELKGQSDSKASPAPSAHKAASMSSQRVTKSGAVLMNLSGVKKPKEPEVKLKSPGQSARKAFQGSDSSDSDGEGQKDNQEYRRTTEQGDSLMSMAGYRDTSSSRQSAVSQTTVSGSSKKKGSRFSDGLPSTAEETAISNVIASFNSSSGQPELTATQQQQLLEQLEMNKMVAEIKAATQATLRKRPRSKAKDGPKYEYDSDEDTEEGTWEHKKRAQEMSETQMNAMQLTQMNKGKHHIADFLPPQELDKFIEKVSAIKEGRTPDFSDYKEHKITEENMGFKMLQKAGWTEGSGLGTSEEGIVDPINKGKASFDLSGVGTEPPAEVKKEDDPFDVYRKRMMLSYRFRPNPLNNPRRPYY